MPKSIDVIAARVLDVVDESGCLVRQVLVNIGRPWQEPTGEWALPYQIVGIGKGKIFVVHGFDAIQALQGVQLVIGAILASSEEGREGRLRWAGERNWGFPVPESQEGDQRSE